MNTQHRPTLKWKNEYIGNLDQSLFFTVKSENILNYKFRFLKRGFDLLCSALILVFVLSWLLPILALLLIFDRGIPVFFVQERVGLHNQLFKCYKLRTMYKCQVSGELTTTRLGKILRYLKLDETPQFLNVLKGEMSIIGPRPHMVSDHEFFCKAIGDRYHLRHQVRPGITGLAQINGFEGPVTTFKKLQGRIQHDLYYIQNWSLRLEFTIFFKTIIYLFATIQKRLLPNKASMPE